jgi:outer membrane protein assembly factor BamB
MPRTIFILTVLTLLALLTTACQGSNPPPADQPGGLPSSRWVTYTATVSEPADLGRVALGPEPTLYYSTSGSGIEADYVHSKDRSTNVHHWKYKIPEGIKALILPTGGNVLIQSNQPSILYKLTPAGELVWRRDYLEYGLDGLFLHEGDVTVNSTSGEHYTVNESGELTEWGTTQGLPGVTTLITQRRWLSLERQLRKGPTVATLRNTDQSVIWQESLDFDCIFAAETPSRTFILSCNQARYEFGEYRYYPTILELDEDGGNHVLYQGDVYYVDGEITGLLSPIQVNCSGEIFFIDDTKAVTSAGRYLVKLDANRQIAWKRARPYYGTSANLTPAGEVVVRIAERIDGNAYYNPYLAALDAETGEQLWKAADFNTRIALDDQGRLFVGDSDNDRDYLGYLRTNQWYELEE